MRLHNRVSKLERSLGSRNAAEHVPLLTRDEMAVAITLQIERNRASNPSKAAMRIAPADTPQMSQDERDKFRSCLNLQIKHANAIEAAGRLPEVLASLRAKGVDV